MDNLDRRKFLKTSALSAAAVVASPFLSKYGNIFAAGKGDGIIRPYPHPWMPKMDFVI